MHMENLVDTLVSSWKYEQTILIYSRAKDISAQHEQHQMRLTAARIMYDNNWDLR